MGGIPRMLHITTVYSIHFIIVSNICI